MQKRKALLLLGPPGSGKTTIAGRMAAQYGFRIVDLGGGERETSRMDRAVLRRLLAGGEGGRRIVLDGFSGGKAEAALLPAVAGANGIALAAVIVLMISRTTVFRRLTGRRYCPLDGLRYNLYYSPPSRAGACDLCGSRLRQAAEDTTHAVGRRLRTFERETIPVIKYFRSYHPRITCDIRADNEIDRVLLMIEPVLGASIDGKISQPGRGMALAE